MVVVPNACGIVTSTGIRKNMKEREGEEDN